MSFFSELVAGGASGLFTGIGTFAKDLRSAITGKTVVDPAVMAELALKAEVLEQAAEKARLDFEQKMSEGQTAINAAEAANKSLFVAGWRPAVGWVCVAGMFYTFLLKPLLPWSVDSICQLFNVEFALFPLPEVPMGDLLVLLGGMLGLGGLRTAEKLKGK
jgi:hypothetical protein